MSWKGSGSCRAHPRLVASSVLTVSSPRCDVSVSTSVRYEGSSSLYMSATRKGQVPANPNSCYLYRAWFF